MASQTTLVDSAEGDSDLDPLIDTQETRGPDIDPTAPPARALYVPSPLPMAELKQQLARDLALAAEEEAASNCPTQRPPPPNLEKAIDRRLVSILDGDEVNAKRK